MRFKSSSCEGAGFCQGSRSHQREGPGRAQLSGADLCINHVQQLFIGTRETALDPALPLSSELNL